MIKIRQHDSTGTIPDEPAAALFQQQWQLYRKFVDYNLLYHREAYGELHRILVDEVTRPFRFLDIACGDASATADALKGTQGRTITESISLRRHSIWQARILKR